MRATSEPRPIVCHLVERLSFGGAQNVVQRLATQLQSSRYDPIVCCLESGPLRAVLEKEGLEVVSLDVRRRSILSGPLVALDMLRIARSLASVVRERRVAVLHAHLPDAILAATVVGRVTQTPVVATYHGLRIVPPDRSRLDPRNAARRALYRAAGRFTDKTIAVSAPVLRMLREELRFREEETVLILNGIETRELERATAPDGLRAELGLREQDRVITCVGRFVEHKRQSVLIDAMPRVLERYQEAVLLFVGDGRTLGEVTRHRDALGLGDRVRFLGSRPDVPAILSLSDVFALTSSYEGIPMAILEAMAVGTPVVATRVPGNLDVVVDERYGLLVPPESPAETADAICRVLASPERAAETASRARARAHEEFDIDQTLASTIAVYDEVLAARAIQPR